MRAAFPEMYHAGVIGSKRKPPVILFMVGILLVLLPLLAFLQYRWQGQVSEGLRGQMQSQMRRAAVQFGEDFDREIRRVYTSFQVGPLEESTPAAREQQLGRDYAELYRKWNQTAPYPSLISEIYLIPDTPDAAQRIQRLNTAGGAFEDIDWPVDLMGLRKTNISVVRMGHAVEQLIQFSGKPIDRKIPAVIIPVADSGPFFRTRAEPVELPVRVPLTQVVVRLNLDYLQKEFFPALAKQHMSNPDGAASYNVAVVDRNGPGRVIYSSKSSADANPKGDVSTEIFTAASLEPQGISPTIAFASRDVLGRSKVVAGNSVFSIRTKEAVTGSLLAALGSDQPWQVVLTHQLGSVDAAVMQARNKNLAINFGILLVLAVSVAFILLSVQRERRLAQQQLEFVSAVSHELRTPLAVICSAGENLADGVVANDEQTRQYGALVRNEGRRLAEMVEQVLDFAGIQSGRKTYKLEPTEVSDVIDRALEMFEMQIRESGITLEKRVPLNLPTLMADRPAIVRAVQNLIANALKYGAAGNWLSVRAESTPVGANIVVEDHGGGISSVDMPHIFEPFYRGRSVIDAQIQGSGLGLSLVKQIVEAHDANITVASEPNRTTFTIAFTLATTPLQPIRAHDQAYSSR